MPNDAILIACIVAVPPTIAGLGTWFQGVRNGTKSDQIHVLVNSNLTSVKADLSLANARIESLEARIVTLQEQLTARKL